MDTDDLCQIRRVVLLLVQSGRKWQEATAPLPLTSPAGQINDHEKKADAVSGSSSFRVSSFLLLLLLIFSRRGSNESNTNPIADEKDYVREINEKNVCPRSV